MLLALSLASFCLCLAEQIELSTSKNSSVNVTGVHHVAKNDTLDLTELLKQLETEETHQESANIVKRQSPQPKLICTCCNKTKRQAGLECCGTDIFECFLPNLSSSYLYPSSSFFYPSSFSYYSYSSFLNNKNKKKKRLQRRRQRNNRRRNNRRRNRRNRRRQI